jgi:hypothetical protein
MQQAGLVDHNQMERWITDAVGSSVTARAA